MKYKMNKMKQNKTTRKYKKIEFEMKTYLLIHQRLVAETKTKTDEPVWYNWPNLMGFCNVQWKLI